MKEFKKSQGGFFICEECQTLKDLKIQIFGIKVRMN